MRALLMLMTCLTLPGVAHAAEPCEAPVSPEAFAAVLAEAHNEAVALHNDVVAQKMQAANAMLPCLSAPITPAMAAEWHVMWGFLRVVEDPEGAQRSYAAARLANPQFPAAEVLGPAKSAMQRYEALPLEGRPMVKLTAPPSGNVYLDGAPTLERSEGWPVIYQWVDADQKMMVSAALNSADPQPAFPDPILVEVIPPDGNGNGNGHTDPVPVKKVKPVKIALLAGAGAAGAVALVGVAGVVGSGSEYQTARSTLADPPDTASMFTARSAAEAAYATNHSRGAMALGGLVAAVGLGAVGVVIDF